LAIKVALPQLLFERIILVNPASAFHRSPWFGWASELVHWVPPFYQVGALGCCRFSVFGMHFTGDRQDLLKTMRSVPQRNRPLAVVFSENLTLMKLSYVNSLNQC